MLAGVDVFQTSELHLGSAVRGAHQAVARGRSCRDGQRLAPALEETGAKSRVNSSRCWN